jgi:exosortase
LRWKSELMVCGDVAVQPGAIHSSCDRSEWLRRGAVVALVGTLIWSYWPTLGDLWRVWKGNQDYSAGQVVPLIAVYLLWSGRKRLFTIPARICWWGAGVLLIAQGVRLAGVLLAYGSLEQYSLVLSVMGIALLVLGFPLAWRLKWILLFLVLIVPLPRRAHESLTLPLQELATSSAVYGLELLGFLVHREGNVLRLDEQVTVAVAEACSGLRMLTAFVIVSATLAFVVRRPAWQKALLLVSSVPVAILANSLRVVVTALLYYLSTSEVAESFSHDFAGLLMMPLAIAASMGLLHLLRWLAADSVSHAPQGS